MTRIVLLALTATGLMASECGAVKSGNACDEYVNYMCDCSEEDCTELTNLYDDEPEQARACDGHDVLSPQRSVENALDEIHRLGDVSYKSAPSVK